MPKRITTEIFIERAIKIHGNKYDYSKVEYKGCDTKVKIICLEHGEFEQTPGNHLSYQGCPACGGSKKLTTEEFVKKAEMVHGDKYDYSKVIYKGSFIKIKIICFEHREFEQTPSDHLSGRGCPKCAGNEKLSTEEFIDKAKIMHGEKYDYSKVNYVNNKTKIIIACPEHGEFEQTPGNHLFGQDCPKCQVEYRSFLFRSNTKEFIKKAKKVHGNKYDYSKIDYVNAKTKVKIICKKHGEFLQTPPHHLKGSGCSECGAELQSKKMLSTTKKFIEKARKKHGDKYDYSKVNYINDKTKVIIICKKHKEFKQQAGSHLSGVGCPICNFSKGEVTILKFLEKHNFCFEYQYQVLECRNKRPLPFDFAIFNEDNDLKFLIEYQGKQHYIPVKWFGGEKNFKIQQHRDLIKSNYCKDNHIPLVIIPYWEYNNIEVVLSKHLKKIKVV